MPTTIPNYIVGVGGTAGGLQAYKALFGAVPADLGMAFVLIAEIIPAATSQLVDILARQTSLRVRIAGAASELAADHLYLMPQNTDLRLEGQRFKLASPSRHRHDRLDVFFTSLAASAGSRAVGIVVSGYGADGSDGCRRIKAMGGTTFCQDDTAEVDSMPRYAIATGCVDFVIPPHEMAMQLQRMAVANPGPPPG